MPNNCPGQSHSFYYVGQEANLTFAPQDVHYPYIPGNFTSQTSFKESENLKKWLRELFQPFVFLVISSGSMVFIIIIWMSFNL